jgi:type I restriction enzyme, S subunit
LSDGTSLPAGWTWASLGELLIRIEAGKSFKCQEHPPHANEVGVVKVSAVTWGEYQELESKTCTDTEMINPALFIQTGDLLFSRANTVELVGACVIARQVTLPLMLSDKILRLKLARDSMKRWVLYLLRSDQGRRQIEALSSGNQESMRNIGQERIAQIRVPLPPLAEQTRIVDKLEELLSDLDAGVAELKAAQKKLALYRQSLLKASVEGALTADWRTQRAAHGESLETGADLLARILTERRARWEARQLAKFEKQGRTPPKGWQAKYPEPVSPDMTGLPVLPKGWVWATIDMLSEIQGGIQKQPSRTPKENKYPFLRVANVLRGKLKLDEIHEIELFDGELERLVLQPEDVLIVEGNGSLSEIGRCARWDGSILNAVHQNHLIRVRPIGVHSAYMEAWLNSVRGIDQVTALAATTSGLYTLNISKISKVPVPVPPYDEQTRLLGLLMKGIEDYDQQEAAVKFGLKQSTAQRKNLLKAAFSGQLVPQDPNDEPASALLARIGAEREAHKSSRQSRQGRRSAHAQSGAAP